VLKLVTSLIKTIYLTNT